MPDLQRRRLALLVQDRTRIAFSTLRGGRREFYYMNEDGSGQTRVTVGNLLEEFERTPTLGSAKEEGRRAREEQRRRPDPPNKMKRNCPHASPPKE